MPPIAVLQQRNTFTLESFRDHHARLRCAIAAASLERIDDLDVIVSINGNGEPAESAKFVRESIYIELVHGALTLTQSVHINNSVKVRGFVVARQRSGFPN